MAKEAGPVPLNVLDHWIAIGVPVTSFGGIGVSLILWYTGILSEAGQFVWGSVISSFLLAILAYRLPRLDIVALLAPAYAIIILVVPMEFTPTLLLQVVFAVSMTILLARLLIRFRIPGKDAGAMIMKDFLNSYIERIRPHYCDIGAETAHEVASAFLSFKFGLYPNATHDAKNALALLGPGTDHAPLKTALALIGERASRLENSDFSPITETLFSPADHEDLALDLSAEDIDDEPSLALDNALILLYAVSLMASDEDQQALNEHQRFIVQLLGTYRNLLDI
ncbi:MAG: hypothetical protein NT074_06945 [Methanomicrobiales archaeon]|nr:hypothetical protein [Methanomicrobiales archaeon]